MKHINELWACRDLFTKTLHFWWQKAWSLGRLISHRFVAQKRSHYFSKLKSYVRDVSVLPRPLRVTFITSFFLCIDRKEAVWNGNIRLNLSLFAAIRPILFQEGIDPQEKATLFSTLWKTIRNSMDLFNVQYVQSSAYI